jgi:glycosyltransferase involved in cell wall biosynthesis
MTSISFVVPCLNEEDLIVDCIGSIKDVAKYSRLKPYEIVVVDNGSTDSTANRARGLGARVVVEKEKGITRARQAGFEASLYDTVAFIDADNVLPHDWAKYALQALNKKNVVAASGPIVYRDLRLYKRVIGFVFYLVAKGAHQIFPMVQGGNFILKKSALQQAHGFNTSIEFYGEDTDTAVRLSKVGKIRFDLDMWAYSSSRRMDEEGFTKTGIRYILNWASIWIFGKPFTLGHHDIRPK